MNKPKALVLAESMVRNGRTYNREDVSNMLAWQHWAICDALTFLKLQGSAKLSEQESEALKISIIEKLEKVIE